MPKKRPRRGGRPQYTAPGFKTYADRLVEAEGRVPDIDTLYSHWGMLYATGQRMRWEGKHDEAMGVQGESDSVRELIEKHHGFEEDVADIFLDEAHKMLDKEEKGRKSKPP